MYGDLTDITLTNPYYRRVIVTTPTQQLVVMSLNVNENIGKERHRSTTQFIRIEQGQCLASINNQSILLKEGDFVTIPPNAWHNIINIGKSKLKLYTIYSPPEHPDQLIQLKK